MTAQANPGPIPDSYRRVTPCQLDDLTGVLGDYLFCATRAKLLRELGQPDKASAADRRALEPTANPA